MTATIPLLDIATWIPILDGDDHGRAQYERHYSARKSLARRLERGTRLFVGPGFKLVLTTPCRRGLFVWRKELYRADGQEGVNCAIFRNEGAGLSSDLIIAADRIADQRWPGERHFTFVDADETHHRRSKFSPPGQCFIHAGWQLCGASADGLQILERLG
jgi:hypothetical protein